MMINVFEVSSPPKSWEVTLIALNVFLCLNKMKTYSLKQIKKEKEKISAQHGSYCMIDVYTTSIIVQWTTPISMFW
jgi:hypothetical protein